MDPLDEFLHHVNDAIRALSSFTEYGTFTVDCESPLLQVKYFLNTAGEVAPFLIKRLLETDLFYYACKAWTTEEFPEEAADALQELIFDVWSGINNDLTSLILSHRSHKRLVEFTHNIYKQENRTWRLHDNWRISTQVMITMREVSLIDLYYSQFKLFEPYLCFLENPVVFFPQICECLWLAESVAQLLKEILKSFSHLEKAFLWNDTDNTNSWKLSFFCELFSHSLVSQSCLNLFARMLNLIDEWQMLLEVALHLLNLVGDIPSVEQVIAEAADTRLMLISQSLPTPMDEHQRMAIWDFINRILERASPTLNSVFFYDQSSDQENADEILDRFYWATYVLMENRKKFITCFTNSIVHFYQRSKEARDSSCKWSRTKSLSAFILDELRTFFSNSNILNKNLCFTMFQLICYDCSFSTLLTHVIIETLTQLLQSINRKGYHDIDIRTKSEVAEDVGSAKDEGVQQNIMMFETICGMVYAASKSKMMAKHDLTRMEDQEDHFRGRLQ